MLDRLTTLVTGRNVPQGWQTTKIAGYRVRAKLASEPTSVGINGSRVIKLDVTDGDELVVHYDRGLDLQEISPAIVEQIIEQLEE